jgi:hypothetical protein
VVPTGVAYAVPAFEREGFWKAFVGGRWLAAVDANFGEGRGGRGLWGGEVWWGWGCC